MTCIACRRDRQGICVADAEEIVREIDAWVSWERWEWNCSSIMLDGEFTLQQMEALIVVLRHRGALALESSTDRS